MLIIPKLDRIRNFKNDLIFSEDDQAGELFFIITGSVLQLFDISEHIKMEPWVSDDQTFNLPIALFSAGSYFGDNGILDLGDRLHSAHRSHTAVCQEDCVFLKISIKNLKPILDDFPQVQHQMASIAQEKKKYFQNLISVQKQKYSNKN